MLNSPAERELAGMKSEDQQTMKLQSQLRTLVGFTTIVLAVAIPPSVAEDSLSRVTAPRSSQVEAVGVVLKEWRIDLDKQAVKTCPVTFRVNNFGDEDHELVIVKTDRHHKALPVSHGKVIETEAGELIGEIEEFPMGEAREATFMLSPGNYALFCNLVEQEEDGGLESHYQEGMHVPFTVLR